MPEFLIVRPMVESKISPEDQQEYWSGVSMLLYLVKYSRPALANMIREISEANNESNPAAYNKLLHVMKYVLDMKKLGFKMEPKGSVNEPW